MYIQNIQPEQKTTEEQATIDCSKWKTKTSEKTLGNLINLNYTFIMIDTVISMIWQFLQKNANND